ncbi:MAG: DNA polymerase I [Elusimicrobia bacterium]|nr:DNA polymerase I [Elusimicrobiota bacterium]
MKTFYIIDGNAYLHRAYHALPPLSTSSGISVNAVYGFVKLLLRIKKGSGTTLPAPDYFAVCFDYPSKNFRHEIYPDYKATRKALEQDLITQMPIAREAVRALNIFTAEVQGLEADDLMAKMAFCAKKENIKTVIVTGDKDILQLVGENVYVWNDSKNIIYDALKVEEKYGLPPQKLPYMFALMGDASDNVPGVKGIGEKTAVKLIKEYGNLENLLNHASDITGRTGELLRSGANDALKSLELVKLSGDKVNCPFNFKDAETKEANTAEANAFFAKYELKSFISKASPEVLSDITVKKSATVQEVYSKKQLNFNTEIIDTIEALKNLALEISKTKHFAFKTLLNNADTLKPEIAGISFACAGKAYYVPLNHNDMMIAQVSQDVFVQEFKEIFENKSIEKTGFDLKRERNICNALGISLKNIAFDGMLAAYCIDPSKHNDVSSTAEAYLGTTLPDESFLGKGNKKKVFSDAEINLAANFGGACALASLELCDTLKHEINKHNLGHLFNNVEMPLVEVLSDMEIQGIKVDKSYLERLKSEMSSEIKHIEKLLYKEAGVEFNINSSKQTSDIMFNKLGFPALKKTKTGYSTDEDVLTQLSDNYPFAQNLLKYREVQKLLSTYVEPIIAYEEYYGNTRIHTVFNQALTTTGRLSSSDPNLQNIPVKTAYGRQIREAFVAGAGKTFFSADYSQIDLRVLAHISEDEALIKAFKSGGDIHAFTAREIFNIPQGAQVDENLRRAAKSINFGIVYGMSPFGLSKQLGISMGEAKSYIDSYFARYHGVKAWMEKIVKDTKRLGYVTTITGRVRYVKELQSSNHAVRLAGERLALNTPIQGSSADIIKIAMLNIYKEFNKQGLQSKLLLQVHDDLLAEISDTEFNAASEIIKRSMENAVTLKVPLEVGTAHGKNWGQMK